MIVVVDYGLGNLGSVTNMLRKLGVAAEVASAPEMLSRATGLILPGVGHFDEGMRNLALRGLREPLEDMVNRGTPVLGICLGMQLMARKSAEGQEPGLGWVPAVVNRFNVERPLSVPHMGWNDVEPMNSALFDGIEKPRFYFVHSYHLEADDPQHVIGWATYGYRFAAAVQYRHCWGTQFHPEKSHRFGMALLRNFARIVSARA